VPDTAAGTHEPALEPTWPSILTDLLHGTDLPKEVTAWAMDRIMSDEATPAQIAGLLIALRAKGETAQELEGLGATMLAHARLIDVAGPAVDIVGTGGDRSDSVNISTMAALVAAGAGARVVKHGNRAASSACGSADLLEALGIDLSLPPDDVAEIADQVGITFCFAPIFHPAMRHAAVPRRELGVPTIFNVLGPLTNPARTVAAAIGCGDARFAELMAEVLASRGTSALVFRGDDGLDEITTTTTTTVWRTHGGRVRKESLDASALGLTPVSQVDLRGGDAAFNAQVVRDLLAGRRGAVRDVVVLNAAAALVALDGVDVPSDSEPPPLVEAIAAAMERASAALDDGSVAQLLEHWVAAVIARL
jgi:anthranilate phosphoribosyltransferase